MITLTNDTPRELVLQACAHENGSINITDLSPEKIRELPDRIAARILFDGDSLTLYASHITQLDASETKTIKLPKLKTAKEIWASEADLHAPELESVGKGIVAKTLLDTQRCQHIPSLLLSGEAINLRGIKSISYAEFFNATSVFLHDTEAIGSEVKALMARHIAAPALQTLTGFFNTKDLKVITLAQSLIDHMGESASCYVSPSAEVKACPEGYRPSNP